MVTVSLNPLTLNPITSSALLLSPSTSVLTENEWQKSPLESGYIYPCIFESVPLGSCSETK